jgi:phage shock protein C
MGTRLYRSRRDRMLAGVAGGLAEIWGADATLVRLIWALLVIFTGGIALVVYIVMAIIVPEEEEVYPGGVPARTTGVAPGAPAAHSTGGGMSPGLLVGGFLVILGGFFLVREFVPQIDFDFLWPFILVAIGVVLIVTAMGRGPRSSPSPPPPSTAPPVPPAAPPPPPTTDVETPAQ